MVRLRALEHQPDIDSTMPPTRMVAVPGCRKKPIMASSGCIRVVMTISIGVSTRTVSILASMLDSFRCPIFFPMLIGALLSMLVSMLVSMFISVLRLNIERRQAGHRDCAERKYHGPHGILHDANLYLGMYDLGNRYCAFRLMASHSRYSDAPSDMSYGIVTAR
ncbi:MAG: hypothetical protein QOI88_1752 [Gammaproteobacteria bacterium]|nr:hypothetical protein [Gammaproteobacteria bacterium]